MSAEGGTRAVIAALLANAFIAVTKFAAWALTGASSMLAEAIHSVADSGNQVLLLVGGRRSRNGARPRSIRSATAASATSSASSSPSCCSASAACSRCTRRTTSGTRSHEGHPNELLESRWWWVPIVILLAAIIAESFSFRTAIRESNKTRGKQRWSKYIRAAKAPELPVILLEDFAALVGLVFALFGVGMTLLTHNGIFDVIGTAMIGLLLVAVAITLAIETKSLLLGEAASPEAVGRIERALTDTPGVERIIHMKTLHLGPEEVLVAAKIAVVPCDTAVEVTDTIDRAESQHPRGRADGHRALPGAGHLRPELRAGRATGASRCARPLVAGVLTAPRRWTF